MDPRGQPMYLHPRISMMGESHIGSVPGSIPINVAMGIPASEVVGLSQEVPMSSNQVTYSIKADNSLMSEQHQQHTQLQVREEVEDQERICSASYSLKTDNDLMTEQQHTQLPIRKEDANERRICSVVLPETPVTPPTGENNGVLVEGMHQIVKAEEEEEFDVFLETAHETFLKISSKEITIKTAAEKLGRPYSYVYSRYQEFCSKVTGDDLPERKKKSSKAKKKKRQKRLTMAKSRPRLSGKTYHCEDCPATFYREAQLKAHYKVHLEDTEAHKCTACGVVFSKLTKLMRHRIEFHQEALQCPHCDSQFTIIASYRYHIRTHTGEKPYACDECGKGFIQKLSLQNHKRTHTGERPYMCGYCEKTFITLNELKRHQYVHTGGQNKPFACEQCGQRYLDKSTLNAHMVVHTGEKPYACELCDQRFTFKCNAMRHHMVHTGEQPHGCDLCDATFLLATDLKRHKISHTGLKPYKCDLCDYACTRKSNLELHKYTHTGETPFKCDFYGCNAEFSRPKNLKKHKLQHGPPAPRICKVCHQQFTELVALKRHMMTHTGEKPYTCDQCFKTCVDKSSLKRHMYKHMYKPLGQKTKQVRQKKSPAVVKKQIMAPDPRKWPEYQVPSISENGHISQSLVTPAAPVSHYSWNINVDETNSQPSFHPITTSQYTNMVNSAWPSTMDPDELRRRLLHSFK